jgi:hypothetical protein
MPTIEEIALELNRRSKGRPIGELQHLRQELKGASSRAERDLFWADHPRELRVPLWREKGTPIQHRV